MKYFLLHPLLSSITWLRWQPLDIELESNIFLSEIIKSSNGFPTH